MDSPQTNDCLYVVQKIVGKKLQGKKVLYKVKWKGYSMDDCTWEKVSHLRYVPDLIEEFEKIQSIDSSKSSIGSTSLASQDETLNNNDPPFKDAEPTHESINEVNEKEEEEALQKQPEVVSIQSSVSPQEVNIQKEEKTDSKTKVIHQRSTTLSSRKLAKKTKKTEFDNEKQLKSDRQLKKDMKKFKKMNKEQSKVSNKNRQESEETAIEKTSLQVAPKFVQTNTIIKSQEDQEEFEPADLKIRLIVAENDSDIRDYVVQYPNGSSKIFNTCEMFYSHPVEFVGYLEKKASKNKK